MHKEHSEGCWVSLILRLAVASLFIGAAVPKWMGPPGRTAQMFQTMFQATWLPMPLVTLHGQLTPWIELVLPIWLILGFRLSWAWTVTGLYLVSLAFGMVVAQKYEVAAFNYLYVLMACAGLHFSRHDGLSIDAFGKKKEGCCGG